jgi:hypothetical protein
MLCICRFEKEYEKDSKLSGYFSKHEINEELHKIFSDIKYIGEINLDRYEKLSTDAKVLQFSILAGPTDNKEEQEQKQQNKDASPPTPITITLDPSQPLQPSPQVDSAANTGDVSKTIYHIENTDTWACKNCKQRDDIWYMKQHNCSMSKV